MKNRKPFRLRPAPKDYLWGGSRLNDDFGKGIDVYPLAETWECSTHPDGQAVAATGEYAGEILGDILKRNPEWLGTHPLRTTGGKPELPILIKLIDAKENLSVQVHPDDDFAMKQEGGLGKTEMWYVLAAKKNAELIFGFNQDLKQEQIRKALKEGSIGTYLNHVSVQKNDVFFVEAGMVHAIGAGCLIAEIQQNSNITYRLYDYNRTDKNGIKRELHIEKALQVVKMTASNSPRQPMRTIKYKNGCASELLSRCKYFQVERLLINTEIYRPLMSYQTGTNSFHALLCLEGCGVIIGDNFILEFFSGDCIFVPASSDPLKLHGKAQLLDICC